MTRDIRLALRRGIVLQAVRPYDQIFGSPIGRRAVRRFDRSESIQHDRYRFSDPRFDHNVISFQRVSQVQLQDGYDISRAWISISQNEQILVAQVAICIEYKYKDIEN